jgi:hypothetical protein
MRKPGLPSGQTTKGQAVKELVVKSAKGWLATLQACGFPSPRFGPCTPMHVPLVDRM